MGRDSALEVTLLRVGGVALFPFLVALGAHVAFPLPPLGVPFSLQTLAVVLAALCLGPKRGMLAMAIYLVAGIIGVPLFGEGEAGMAVLLGQTGGYIVGFIAAQPVITRLVRRGDGGIRGWAGLALSVIAGHAVIFLVGVPWLYVVRSLDPESAVTWGQALWGGMVIFLPGMVIKAALAVWIGRLAAPWAARRIW